MPKASTDDSRLKARLSPRNAILALLFAPDAKKDNSTWNWAAPVEGKTRLVKELFLLTKETDSGPESLTFPFTPGPYGPSAIDLTNALDDMIRREEIGASTLPYGRAVVLRLVGKPGGEARSLWASLEAGLRRDLYAVKSRFNDMGYKPLLRYVYRKYPAYTTNSLIREEILSGSS